MRFWKLWTVLLAIWSIGGCSSSSSHRLTVAMDWSVNTNHVAIITALDKGFYREQGLDVQLVDFGKTGASTLVSRKQADLGLSSEGELVFAVQGGAPIISVATLFNHNLSGFYSLASANIASPADLQGKSYGGWGSSMEEKVVQALITQGGVLHPSFENRTLGSSNVVLALKSVDFIWGFAAWQGIQLKLAHVPTHFLPVAQYIPALDDYSPIIIVNTQSSIYKENPEKIRKFLRATEKGARWALAHPQESATFLLDYDETLSPILLHDSLKILLPQMLTAKGDWGRQEEQRYQNYLNFFEKVKLVRGSMKAGDLFTNAFLSEVRQADGY